MDRVPDRSETKAGPDHNYVSIEGEDQVRTLDTRGLKRFQH